MPLPFLMTLLVRLEAAISADELEQATRPPADVGIRHSSASGVLHVDDRLLPHPLPRVTLALDPPVDARALCAAWRMARPVAVSADVEQRTWSIRVGGGDLPDPHNRRIASQPITAGRWEVTPRLAVRPAGHLPALVSGASPAYDVRERGGAVSAIAIAPTAHEGRTFEPDHADACTLLAAMTAAQPSWRGSGDGWIVPPGAMFVALYDPTGPVAGAALRAKDDGLGTASQVCILANRADNGVGAALLDLLEAVARDRGCIGLRLDSSAFLQGEALPHGRCGYAVGPPYAGDADVDVWVEKKLYSRTRAA